MWAHTSRDSPAHTFIQLFLHFPLFLLPQGIWSPPDVKLRTSNAIDSQLIFPQRDSHSKNFIFFSDHTVEGGDGCRTSRGRVKETDGRRDRQIYTWRHIYMPFFTSRCHSRILLWNETPPEIGVEGSKVEAINSMNLSHSLTVGLNRLMTPYHISGRKLSPLSLL